MSFSGFNEEDFHVFNIEGLENRMEAIKIRIRPKLEQLGEHFAPTLSTQTGDEMFFHVAKHARRKVNPPKDTWVAFANNKRGYKMLPHFQIGLFESHLFIWFAIIYESPIKGEFANKLLEQSSSIASKIPPHFKWSGDHMQPEATDHRSLSKDDLISLFSRLRDIKKAELLCGIHIERNDPVLTNGQALIELIDETFQTVMPLYKLAQQASVQTKV